MRHVGFAPSCSPASYGLQGESSSAWKPSDLVILAGDLLNAQKVDAAWCSYSSWIYDWHQVVSIWWYPMISTTDQDVNRVVDLNMADGNLIPKKHSKNKQCCCCCCCVAHPRMTVKLTKFQDGSGVLCMFWAPEGSQDVPGTIRYGPWWFEKPFRPLNIPCILSPHAFWRKHKETTATEYYITCAEPISCVPRWNEKLNRAGGHMFDFCCMEPGEGFLQKHNESANCQLWLLWLSPEMVVTWSDQMPSDYWQTTRPRCRSHMLFDGTSAWTFVAYWSEPRSHAVAGDLLITSCESSVVNYLSRLFEMISRNQVSSNFKVTMISSSELFLSRPCPWHDLWHLQPVILASLFTLVTHH